MSSEAIADMFGLAGRTALVTGGGSGIGKAIALCLAQAGARVVIAGRNGATLEAAADELGNGVETAVLDIADTAFIADFEAQLAGRFGPIDILINNAGNTLKKPFEDSNLEEFDQVFDVHVRGALELTRCMVKRLLAAERPGSVVFLSSMTAYIGQPLVSGYTISKTAIDGVVRGLSAELAGRNIRINGVAPGWIDTDLYRKATSGDIPRQQKILGRIPMQKLGQPSDIGWACTYLSSNAASYVTGQVVRVDGGAATGF